MSSWGFLAPRLQPLRADERDGRSQTAARVDPSHRSLSREPKDDLRAHDATRQANATARLSVTALRPGRGLTQMSASDRRAARLRTSEAQRLQPPQSKPEPAARRPGCWPMLRGFSGVPAMFEARRSCDPVLVFASMLRFSRCRRLSFTLAGRDRQSDPVVHPGQAHGYADAGGQEREKTAS